MNTIRLSLKKNVWLICLSMIFVFSCKEDEISVYEGETNVFFLLKKWSNAAAKYSIDDFPVEEGLLYSDEWTDMSVAWDSIIVSLARDGTNKGYHIALIPVRISGNTTDYDRPLNYTLGANSTAVEGEHFKVNALIPANKRDGALAVSINRETVRDMEVFVDFILKPNEYFQTNYAMINRSSSDTTKVDMHQFRLRMSSFITPPSAWNTTLIYYLGAYSQKKMFLILELTGGDINELYKTNPSLPLMTAWGKILKVYLNEQRNSGNIIYEEDGVTPMNYGVLV